ncbi:ribbon-helix-helix domain-containing protein [Azospirillum halopraeferens]|uniref:ribbon-helix-helix domain-containing protein n=1 Tax=Azospirillum halopraeferens TaxID=34010 RepID=UPI00041EC37E|nr:ribbon-helix-helix domain-containing protein [Azospirillum halopraeferens]
MQFLSKSPIAGGEIGLLSDLMSRATADVAVARTVRIGAEHVGVRLESAIWAGLIDIGEREGRSIDDLCVEISDAWSGLPLSTGIRVFVLNYFRGGADVP